MQKYPISVLAAMLLTVSLAGCNNPYFTENVLEEGAQPLIDSKSFQKIDLALLLDPEGLIDSYACRDSDACWDSDDCCDSDLSRRRLQRAFNAFYANPNNQILRRNRVQDRIIASSNQRCAVYKRFLKRIDMTNNLFLGGITTVAAGLGSIFTNAATVRALSGSAAIASGLRGEINDVFLHKKTIQFVANGIESRRKAIYYDILKRRELSADDMKKYNVEKAVADAIVYHDACSLVIGLEQVALNHERAENPGLNELERTLKRLKKMGLEMGKPTGADDALSKLEQTTNYSSGADPAVHTYTADARLIPLPLSVFLEAEKSKSKLEELKNEINNSKTTSIMEKLSDENTSKKLKEKSCKLTSDEIEFVKKWMKKDGVRVIVEEIDALISHANEGLPNAEKSEAIKLQNNVLERLSEMVVAKTEEEKKNAVEKLNQALQKAGAKVKELFPLQSDLEKKVAKANRVLEITNMLDDQIKKIERCNNST